MSLSQQWGPPGSPTIEPPFIELATDGVSWKCRTFCLKVSLYLVGSSSRCFLHHSNNPSLQSLIKFSLVATSREVGYSAMGLKLPYHIVYDGHRNINGWRWTCSLEIVHAWLQSCLTSSDNSLVFFLFSMLIAVHTVTQTSRMTPFLSSKWLNEWFLYCRHLQLTTGVFTSKVKENHLLEI